MRTATKRLVYLLWLGMWITAGGAAADEPGASETEQSAPDGAGSLDLASQARAEGRLDDAEAGFRAAVTQFDHDGDPRGERVALVNLGLLLAEVGRVDEAVEVFRRAIELADDAVDRGAPTATRVLLADLLIDADRPVEALAWADAGLIAAAAVDRSEHLLAPIAAYLRTARSVDDSPATLRAAAEHVEGRLDGTTGYEGSPWIPRAVFSHGVAELDSGDALAALAAMDLAVATADALGAVEDLPSLLTGLGFVAMQAGEGERARRALERGCAIGPDVPLLATLAQLERQQGWLGRAGALFDDAIDLAREQDLDDDAVELQVARADLNVAAGALEVAREEHERALDQMVRRGDDHAVVVQRVKLARLDARLARWGEARRLAERSLSANRVPFGQLGEAPVYRDPRAAAGALAILARVYWEKGEPGDAQAALAQAQEVMRSSGVEHTAITAAFGYVALLRDEPERALTRFDRSADEVADWRLALGRGEALVAMGDLTGAEEALREALAAQEGQPRDETWDPFVPPRCRVREALVSLLLQQRRQTDALEVVLEPLGRTVSSLRSALGPDSAAVAYGATPEEGVLWVVTAEAVSAVRLGVPRIDIERQVLAHAEAVASEPAEGRRSAGIWRESSRVLFDLLLRPASGELSDAEELVVVPDAVLARVPFATLLDEDEPLVGRYRLVVAGPPVDAPRRPLPRRPAVAALSPSFEDGHAEIESLRSAYRRADVVQAPSAEVALAALHDYDLVHVSLSAEPNPLQPHRTILRTSRQPEGEVALSEVDGIEMEASLAVVTGLQPEPALGLGSDPAAPRPNPASVAVADALLRAGVGAAVVDPWLIEPADRAELLREFYRGLGRKGPAEAMQRAQVRMAGSDVHPYYWGGWLVFLPTGDSAL